ncbi:hypothetical protein [Vibrio brasiliensis]
MKLLGKILMSVSILLSCNVSAEKLYTDIAGYGQLSDTAQSAVRDFDDKVGFCLEETRNNNPFPVSKWLIGLPQDKQGSVLMYLSNMAMFNCSEDARNKLEWMLKQQGETQFLAMIQEQGWLSPPVYGEFVSREDRKHIQLSVDDEADLKKLIERHYQPFDVIQTKLALDLLKER